MTGIYVLHEIKHGDSLDERQHIDLRNTGDCDGIQVRTSSVGAWTSGIKTASELV